MLRINLLVLSFTAFADDEQKYHQLGRDYVTCKWSVEIPQLKLLSLRDRAVLHDSAQEACSRWRSQNRHSVLEPPVERAFELAPEALVSWRCDALERFSQASALSDFALLAIQHLNVDCTGEVPLVKPKLTFQTWLNNHYDTIILFTGIYVLQRLFPNFT